MSARLTAAEREMLAAARIADAQGKGWHRKRWCVTHDDLIPRLRRVCSMGGYYGDGLDCSGIAYVGRDTRHSGRAETPGSSHQNGSEGTR